MTGNVAYRCTVRNTGLLQFNVRDKRTAGREPFPGGRDAGGTGEAYAEDHGNPERLPQG